MTSESLILIAEDSGDDLSLLLDTFNHGRLANPVQAVRDGEQVIAYLGGEGIFSNREKYPLPALLLLDLDLPRKHGLEVLEWIRRQPALTSLRAGRENYAVRHPSCLPRGDADRGLKRIERNGWRCKFTIVPQPSTVDGLSQSDGLVSLSAAESPANDRDREVFCVSYGRVCPAISKMKSNKTRNRASNVSD